MRRLEFFYDISCPYAYLAFTQITNICDRYGAELVLKPMLLGGIFRHWSRPQNMADEMNPTKSSHNFLDMQRWASYWEVPLHIPKKHPIRTVEALRLVLVSPPEVRVALTRAFFEAYWVQFLDIRDRAVLEEIVSGIGLDGAHLLTLIETPEVKLELRECTDEAIKRGVFGAPTMFLDGRRYWGQDRLHLVEHELAQKGDALLTIRPLGAPEPGRSLIFYFDFSSPFAYLASVQIEALAQRCGAVLQWHPMLLGAVFQKVGAPNVPLDQMIPPKQTLSLLDMQRHADLYGVDFKINSHFPLRTVAPLRLLLAVEEQAPEELRSLTHRIFRAAWVEDRNIGEVSVLKEICAEAGIDGALLLARIQAPEIKQRLFQKTEEALEQGVFGAPTFQVDHGEVIWGQDRLEIAAWLLHGARDVMVFMLALFLLGFTANTVFNPLSPSTAQAQDRVEAKMIYDLPILIGSVAISGGIELSGSGQPGLLGLPRRSSFDGIAPEELNIPMVKASDILLTSSVLAGGVWMITEDFLGSTSGDHFVVWLETVAVTSLITQVFKYSIRRPRPYTYGDPSEERKTDDNLSFFSGHTSHTAAALFGAARIFDIESSLSVGERTLMYGGATIITGFIGWLRVDAGKHFPSDVLVGALVGGSIAFLIPELHRVNTSRTGEQSTSLQVTTGLSPSGPTIGFSGTW